jgi:hypothetical protein
VQLNDEVKTSEANPGHPMICLLISQSYLISNDSASGNVGGVETFQQATDTTGQW